VSTTLITEADSDVVGRVIAGLPEYARRGATPEMRMREIRRMFQTTELEAVLSVLGNIHDSAAPGPDRDALTAILSRVKAEGERRRSAQSAEIGGLRERVVATIRDDARAEELDALIKDLGQQRWSQARFREEEGVRMAVEEMRRVCTAWQCYLAGKATGSHGAALQIWEAVRQSTGAVVPRSKLIAAALEMEAHTRRETEKKQEESSRQQTRQTETRRPQPLSSVLAARLANRLAPQMARSDRPGPGFSYPAMAWPPAQRFSLQEFERQLASQLTQPLVGEYANENAADLKLSSTVREVLASAKTLADIPAAQARLKEQAVPPAVLQELETLASCAEKTDRGLGCNLPVSGDGVFPELLPLRLEVLRKGLPALLYSASTPRLRPDQTLGRYVEEAIETGKANGDARLLIRAAGVRWILDPGCPMAQADMQTAQFFQEARNFDTARFLELAVSCYIECLKSASDLVPAQWIAGRIEQIGNVNFPPAPRPMPPGLFPSQNSGYPSLPRLAVDPLPVPPVEVQIPAIR
jgi:hypothetical protein